MIWLSAQWRAFGAGLFSTAMQDNLRLMSWLSRQFYSSGMKVLDLGCGDGVNLRRYSPPGATLFGVEMSHDAARAANASGIYVAIADLNRSLPLRSEEFDVVTSNQVIEHLYDTDRFLQEIHRVLKPGGLLIVSTENLSSWHNIGALALGWQAFSLTNVSKVVSGIGNPLANLRGEEPSKEGWQHLRLFSYRGLLELISAHGFADVRVRGSGYYPLPAKAGHLDPRHAVFITAAGVRLP
jgi:SAM-dependent methyltransferase